MAVEKTSGGGIIIKERQQTAGAGAGGPKIRKKNRKSLTVPKLSRKRTHSTQHNLNTLPKTYPISLHRGEGPSRLSGPIAYVKA